MCKDRSDDTRYFNIVFFDSYESAMENSNLPEAQELAATLAGLTQGEPTFYDLDGVEIARWADPAGSPAGIGFAPVAGSELA